MNFLFVVAHPDDETLAAGATIAKLVKDGHNVAVATMCINADARANKSNTLFDDRKNALDILGVTKTYNADFPNIKMNTVPHLDLVQFVESCILDFKADCVVTHHPSDINNDHVVTSYAVQAASRISQRKTNVLNLKALLYMETLSCTEWSFDLATNKFNPNYFVEVGKEGIDLKIKAMSMYKGVMREYPHPRSIEGITGLAAYRGGQAGCNYAEAFESAFIKY